MRHIQTYGRPQALTSAQKAQIIEYWVNNPDKTKRYIGKRFNINHTTLSMMLTRDYIAKKPHYLLGLTVIILPSKINEPELITID